MADHTDPHIPVDTGMGITCAWEPVEKDGEFRMVPYARESTECGAPEVELVAACQVAAARALILQREEARLSNWITAAKKRLAGQ